MFHHALPALYALFVWWFSTGVILYLDGMDPRTFRWSMLGATILLIISLHFLATSSADPSVSGAYTAFTFGVLAWGWLEISFYMGIITGPRREPCPEGCSGWSHFGHAIQVSLYHELGILATAAAVFGLAWPGANHVGIWTFAVLWWMHQSAKLNVFLGVRNVNEEFVPDHLAVLRSFLTKKPMNLLFPVSVTISTVIAFLLVQKAVTAASPFDAAGYSFLGTLMVLAIVEHWFLILPLPFAALWRWGLKSRPQVRPFDIEIVAGFLGAGKTTFLRRLLASADPAIRTIVLVNDFGALGIDGSLLSGRGAEVVELPNGCICCSLRQDLAQQLQEVVARWAPQRILIEPSGVADVAALLSVLDRPALKSQVKTQRVCTIIDAGNFLQIFQRMHTFIEAQTSVAPLLVINKTDLVSAAELKMVEATLRELNPSAVIVSAKHGLLQTAAVDQRSAMLAQPVSDDLAKHATDHEHETALGFTSWSTRLGGACHPEGLQDLLDAVTRGVFGEIERVKGIARAGPGWVHFDVAGGRSTIAAFAPSKGEEPRVTAIGRTLDRVRLQAAFDVCAEQARAS